MNKPSLSLITTCAQVTLAAMEEQARALAALLRSGDMITLRGDVGAGKTTFARALAQALMPEVAEVTSPTFNLMQSYDIILADGKPETLWHLDLYRLEDAAEADMLGLRELERHVMLIEWPEIIAHMLPPTRLEVTFAFSEDTAAREVNVYGEGGWRERLGLSDNAGMTIKARRDTVNDKPIATD